MTPRERLIEETSRRLRAAVDGADADPAAVASMSLIDGYAAQDHLTRLWVESGDPVVGYKIGLTTPPAQNLFAATEPGTGRLFASTVQQSPGRLTVSRRPLLFEIEVAVVLDPASGEIGRVEAAVEIVASRWAGGAPGLGAWAADNAMAAAAVVGTDGGTASRPLTAPPRATASLAGQTWSAEGESVQTSLNWLQEHVAQRGLDLPSGALILTGSIVGPCPVPAGGGLLTAEVDGIGSVKVEFVPEA